MIPLFNKLYKVDISQPNVTERPEYQDLTNFSKYIQDMLELINNKTAERYYEFRSQSTEVRNLISQILQTSEYNDTSLAIANRLLDKEKLAQNDLDKKNLKKEITKGMLIITLVKMTEGARKFIVLKVDYDEFISEMTGEIVSGLSIKRKVYKAFVCEINNSNEITYTSVFDTNSPVSTYWWDKFLELKVVTTDNENTKNAFDAIEKEILNPIKKKHKQDYLHLWNATIAYFRGEGEFMMNHYKDDIIGNYVPFDDNLEINTLKSKIESLPAKHKFDIRFNKIPGVITKKFKNTLPLTTEIDLVIKHDIANPSIVFKSYVDKDGKYLMIRSEEGYKYAERIKNNKNEVDD